MSPALLLLALALSQAPETTPPPQAAGPIGFSSLFNGSDLTGWRGRPHLSPYEDAKWETEQLKAKHAEWQTNLEQHWSVDAGEIVNDGHGVFLTTVEDFDDFELRLEYKTVAQADSGIYLRASPQVQIWDTTEAGGKWNIGADKGSGALWNNQENPRFPLVHADRPFGEWNRLRILMVGDRVSVWLNERQTVAHARMENYWQRGAPLPRSGPVQLQTHGGEIRFRNLYVRRLDAAEANAVLARNDRKGFRSVFNGLDWNGWAGPVENYFIDRGTIVCKPGKGGTIFTKKEYGDFHLRFEFQLPPGGNNGLAIRYPGQGDAAYHGMCELQVLDNSAEKYAGLKEWQYHGSVYGQKAALRGYQRAVGQWNFQEVRVQGSHIRVELNGHVILNQDLAAIETPPSGREHPGRTRLRGHFGFAGHNDPVRFRRVEIREIGSD